MIGRWGWSICEESTWVLKDLERGGPSRSGDARFNGGAWAEERERERKERARERDFTKKTTSWRALLKGRKIKR